MGYKFGRWYNMVWMEKHLGEHSSKASTPVEFDAVRGIIKEKYQIG